jgi:chromosome segregation ATPase
MSQTLPLSKSVLKTARQIQLSSTPLPDQKPITLIAEQGSIQRDSILLACENVEVVCNEASQQLAATTLAEIQGFLSAVELERKAAKAPFKLMGETIDSAAGLLTAQLEVQKERIKGLVKDFQQAQRDKAAEEHRKQQAELRRIAMEEQRVREKAEREKREAEQRVKEAEAEAARITKEVQRQAIAVQLAKGQAEAAPSAKSNPTVAADIKQAEVELAALRTQQQAVAENLAAVATESAAQTQRAAEEAELRTATLHRQAEAALVVLEPAKAEGIAVSTKWKFEVLDAAEFYKARPDLCEIQVKTAEVNKVIRGPAGLHEIPGLRIYSEIDVNSR